MLSHKTLPQNHHIVFLPYLFAVIPLTSWPSKAFPPFRLPHQNPVYISLFPSTCHMLLTLYICIYSSSVCECSRRGVKIFVFLDVVVVAAVRISNLTPLIRVIHITFSNTLKIRAKERRLNDRIPKVKIK